LTSEPSDVVGRDHALRLLGDAASSARAGRGAAIVVEGEAGMGKTTLLNEFERRVPPEMRVVWGRTRPDGDAPALWVWAQVLREVDGLEIPSAPTRVEQFDAMARVIEDAAAVQPLVVIIDDVHWADAASVLLLAHVSARVAQHRILMVAASRNDEPLDEVRREARSELIRTAATIRLPGLDEKAIAQLLAAGDIAAEPQLVDALVSRTRGNPFFVTRLVAMLGARRADAAGSHRVVASEVPSEVAEVVRRRVARLATPTAALLSAASVLGTDGRLDTLAAVAEFDIGATLAMIEATEGMLVEVEPDGFAFSHALVRDSVYASLSAVERRELHVRALEHTDADPASLNARARHAVAALPLGDRLRAVELCTEAARAARARLAFEDAAQRFALAIDVGRSELTPSALGALYVELGEAWRSAGVSDRARPAFLEAAALGDDPELLARAALGYADPGADLAIAFQSNDPETVRLLERAITGTTDDATAARLRARLASELYFSDQPERAEPLALEAIELAERSGDEAAIVTALASFHDAFLIGGETASAALAAVEPITRHARASRDPIALLTAHRARLFALVRVGDFEGVDAEIKAFTVRAESLGSRALLWWPALWHAMRALLGGRYDDAQRHSADALAIGDAPFGGLALFNSSFLFFFMLREQGGLAEIENATRQLAEAQADIPAIQTALSLLLAEIGKTDEAGAALERLRADGFARLHDRNWPASWFMLARAAYLCGDRESAALLFEAGARFRGECIMVSLATVCLGSADLALAWCAHTLGDVEAADAAYTRATATNARIGARPWHAQAQADHATLTKPDDSIAGAQFERDGATWRLQYDGRAATLAHAKGLIDIAWLLARPHEPVPAIELVARQNTGEVSVSRGDPVLDERARRELRDRLMELDRDLADAEAANDIGSAERLHAERDALLEAAAQAFGFGRRDRRLGDDAERARKAVTARIRNAVGRIADVHPALAAHLERSIDTGAWCVYRPERPVTWTT
jgi:tetratricopeptide (TPR) repeat protein